MQFIQGGSPRRRSMEGSDGNQRAVQSDWRRHLEVVQRDTDDGQFRPRAASAPLSLAAPLAPRGRRGVCSSFATRSPPRRFGVDALPPARRCRREGHALPHGVRVPPFTLDKSYVAIRNRPRRSSWRFAVLRPTSDVRVHRVPLRQAPVSIDGRGPTAPTAITGSRSCP